MSRRNALREDSAAHKTICFLVDLGGTATKATLLASMSTMFLNRDRFRRSVTAVLEHYGYAIADRYSLRATQAGKDFVADYVERINPSEPDFAGHVALPRVAQPARPFNFIKHYGGGSYRAGANDHRDIPSLMGNQRIIPGTRTAK